VAFLVQTMAHQVLILISSDSSEYAEEEDVGSPVHSDAGSNPSVSSSSWASSIQGCHIKHLEAFWLAYRASGRAGSLVHYALYELGGAL
jgi:hypothetical protein